MRAAFAALLLCASLPARAQAEALRPLDIVDGAVPAAQRVVAASKGDRLRLRVTSNQPGELHLHAYRQRLAVQPGAAGELAFTAHATGRFRIEWHAAGAANGDHHAPALATLEVRPP